MTSTAVLWFDEIDSTNAEARRLAQAGEVGPLWICARTQTAGVGRRGRSWTSEPGNLFATLLTVTDKPAGEAAQLSFVAALAVCDFARAHLPPEQVRVKWPNDVMIGDEKASGILVESGRRDDGALWVGIGVGVNLAHAPDNTERPATALARHMSTPPTPEQAMEGLAAAFDDWFGVWEQSGFAPIADAWTLRAYRLGEPCIARLALETVSGVAEGLDADGSLRLRLPDGSTRRITAGDVFFGDP
jgi:BirA family biotin operon repressor/biotin-[acetyl-CoA-carboxylase] ligase